MIDNDALAAALTARDNAGEIFDRLSAHYAAVSRRIAGAAVISDTSDLHIKRDILFAQTEAQLEVLRACGKRVALILAGEHADVRVAALEVKVTAIEKFHQEWGNTDAEEIDQLELWEALGRILKGGES